MKAVLQRSTGARVIIDGACVGKIDRGLVILLGISKEDCAQQAGLLASKIACLRIFEDETGKLNRSLIDIDGGALVISNFTLYADCRHGRRPDFMKAAKFDQAEPLYETFISQLRTLGVTDVQTGRFGADMRVELVNDGPVTVILDTEDFT